MILSGKCMSCLVMPELDIAHWIPLTLVRRERIIHNQIRVTGQALPFTQTKRAYRKGSKLCMVHPIFRVARLSQLMCLFSFKIEKLESWSSCSLHDLATLFSLSLFFGPWKSLNFGSPHDQFLSASTLPKPVSPIPLGFSS